MLNQTVKAMDAVISFRKATIEDIYLLLSIWAEDSLFWVDSEEWKTFDYFKALNLLNKSQESPLPREIIFEVDSTPVGLIGIHSYYGLDNAGVLYYAIFPEHRKQGYSCDMLDFFEDFIADWNTESIYKIQTLVAEVHPDNVASIKVLTHLAYKNVGTNDNQLIVYAKHI